MKEEGNCPTAAVNSSEGTRRFLPLFLFSIGFAAAWSARVVAGESISFLASLFVVVLATALSLLVLNQQLPLQNVVAVAVVLAIFSGAITLAATVLGISFVPPVLNPKFSELPLWIAPLLWIVALVNARGVAKLFLRRFRHASFYGWMLIAFSSLLVAGFSLHAESNWKIFCSQLFLASVAFVVTTPWFIDKKPIERAPDFQPLFLTLLLLVW